MKGPSWLCIVPGFDMISGMSIDYMHCVLLGVCRMLQHYTCNCHSHLLFFLLGDRYMAINVHTLPTVGVIKSFCTVCVSFSVNGKRTLNAQRTDAKQMVNGQ